MACSTGDLRHYPWRGAEEKYNSLVASNPQAYQGLDHKIYSAVRLQEDASELGYKMTEGYVLTEQHWNRIVQENAEKR